MICPGLGIPDESRTTQVGIRGPKPLCEERPVEKPKIRLAFSDFPSATDIDLLSAILSERYQIALDENRPDYVIYSVFGDSFLKFQGAVRICFLGENVRPDFNLCDYAFTFDWLDFGDRHFRAPHFILYPQWRDLLTRRSSNIVDLRSKPEFCNFIYTNGYGHPNRAAFFHALNEIKHVESFGTYLRNSNRNISDPYVHDWNRSKVEAQRSFRFSIAFENSSTPGYTTEKIVHALAADTIPIYWGDPLVARVFNPERFIDVGKLGFEMAIERIIQLEEDQDAFIDIVNRPFFAEGAPLDQLTPEAMLDVFSHIFDQPLANAFRRNMFVWGPKYEAKRRCEIRAYQTLMRVGVRIPWLARKFDWASVSSMRDELINRKGV